MVAWLLTRHIAYLLVCWSIYVHLAPDGLIPHGCYDTSVSPGRKISSGGGSAVWANIIQSYANPDGVVCFNSRIQYGFLGLLMALQVLTLIWFGMIVRVAYGVITGKGAQDNRSDDEGGEDEDVEIEEVEVVDPPLEESPAVLERKTSLKERGVEEPREVKRTSPGPSGNGRGKRKGRGRGARASGISIPGHGDHKELLGRIGCDKPS
jgi:acyl-CoA-dependent ceramide synthase